MVCTGEAWIVNERDRVVLRAEIAAQLAPLTGLLQELRADVREDRQATTRLAADLGRLQTRVESKLEENDRVHAADRATAAEGTRQVHARVGRVETWIRLLVLSGVGAGLTGLVYLVTRKP